MTQPNVAEVVERLETVCSSDYSDDHVIRTYERITLGDLRTVLEALSRPAVADEELIAQQFRQRYGEIGAPWESIVQAIAEALGASSTALDLAEKLIEIADNDADYPIGRDDREVLREAADRLSRLTVPNEELMYEVAAAIFTELGETGDDIVDFIPAARKAMTAMQSHKEPS